MRGTHGLARSVLVAVAMAGVPTATSVAVEAAPPEPPDEGAKIDPAVIEAVDDGGTTTFWVRLGDHADLSAATAITDWAERGAYVVDQLKATATASQAPVRAQLDARGAKYTSYWVTNALRVRGGEALVDKLAANPAVEAITAPVTYQVPDPVGGSTDRSRVNAVEWGIDQIGADDVWSQFGVRGEGIVIANIDTGVQFDHPALVNQYRGNLDGGSFDHNYNWWDPTGVCGTPMATPCDNHGHGTHTMGTMVGDDGAGNQIGVAPGARWIGVKGCENNNCSDASLLSAGQFVLAPTDLAGTNPRPDLRPDIVNNSWGGGGNDPWYRDLVQAWRAAGIFPQFSGGNDGAAGCGSASSPGDYPRVLRRRSVRHQRRDRRLLRPRRIPPRWGEARYRRARGEHPQQPPRQRLRQRQWHVDGVPPRRRHRRPHVVGRPRLHRQHRRHHRGARHRRPRRVGPPVRRHRRQQQRVG